MSDKTESFKRTSEIWEERIPKKKKKCFSVFPNLTFNADTREYHNLRCLTSVTVDHMGSLSEHFSVYFPPDHDPRNGNEWVRNTFSKNNIMGTSLTPNQLSKLLSHNRELEASLSSKTNLSAF
jgi:hypothetical protein